MHGCTLYSCPLFLLAISLLLLRTDVFAHLDFPLQNVQVLLCLGQALGELMANYFVNPTLLRVVRVARVGRVLRLVKGQCTGSADLAYRCVGRRSERHSNFTLCFGCVHARAVQYWSASIFGDVYLFDLWHVLLCLRA